MRRAANSFQRRSRHARHTFSPPHGSTPLPSHGEFLHRQPIEWYNHVPGRLTLLPALLDPIPDCPLGLDRRLCRFAIAVSAGLGGKASHFSTDFRSRRRSGYCIGPAKCRYSIQAHSQWHTSRSRSTSWLRQRLVLRHCRFGSVPRAREKYRHHRCRALLSRLHWSFFVRPYCPTWFDLGRTSWESACINRR